MNRATASDSGRSGWQVFLAALRPRSRPPNSETASERRMQALRIVGLWCLAVAQPVFDVVGRSPEFFIAHDAGPGDLLTLVVLLCLGGPAVCLLVVRLAELAGGARWRGRAVTTLVAGLVAAVALAALKPLSGADGGLLVALAVLAGVASAVAYCRFAAVRTFTTFLAPAALVVPAVFLLNSNTSRLLAPQSAVAALDGVTFDTTPPVVVVVFDQLQLSALLDRDGNIDRAAFPNFAELADDATWFRNATAAAALTTQALPAVLTGMRPSEGRLPVAAEHPANLFTLLGGRYEMHVLEPLTGLCPETLCPPARVSPTRAGFGAAGFVGVIRDLAIVYLTVLLPDDLAAPLPPVDQNWKDFAVNLGRESLGDRWQAARLDDRRESIDDFIAGIDAGAGPTLHFMHALLPHEPFLYLPTGQQFTFHRDLVGLRGGKWSEDPWAAALNHHRYVLQVAYVDTLLGRLLARLREVGIHDDALIVVTADHGLNLQPGQPPRLPTASSFLDVAGVPLFIKRPGQRRGEVVDSNVEVIDVVPTLAALLGVELPWVADGVDIFDPARPSRPTRTVFYTDAGRTMEVPGNRGLALIESAARKFEWYEPGDLLEVPTPDGRYGNLIGSAAGPLVVERRADFEVVVDVQPAMRDVDPHADFLPAHVTGAVAGLADGAPAPTLAIVLNGTVAAVTRPYSFPVAGRRDAWEAILDPGRLAPGFNTLEVFEVREEDGGASVALAATRGDWASDRLPDLAREEDLQQLGGQSSGLHGQEWLGGRPFRWTRGNARLVVPLDPEIKPHSLAVEVLMTGQPKQFRIVVDGCVLFDETINERWSATFELAGCPLAPPELEIELLSDTHVPSTRDDRRLGVAVGRIELRPPDSTP
jgi:hypothetical protein